MHHLYYLSTYRPTYAYRRTMRSYGMLWDHDRKQWFAHSRDIVERSISLVGGGHVREVDLDVYPTTKGKPRGATARKDGDEGDDSEEMEEAPLPRTEERTEESGAASDLARIIRNIAGGAVDANTVRQIVAEEMSDVPTKDAIAAMVANALENIPARTITVKLEQTEGLVPKTLDGARHKLAETVLKRISLGFKNLFLSGPAGCGKTTLVAQVAEALGLRFASVSCSAGMSESVLLGRLLPIGENGQFAYTLAQFVDLYENGGVFLLDEGDASDANTLLVMNSALANGHLDIPNRIDNPVAKRHPNFICFVAANTWGAGATREYVGRNQLDAAFLDRFVGAKFYLDYDRDLELTLVTAIAPEGKATEFLAKAYSVRERITSTGMRRIFGTRSLISGAKLLHGYSVSEVMSELTCDWTPDEKAKVGIS